MPEIITVGEILVEIMATEVGQKLNKPGKFIGPFPSGAPAIFADQAARMGGDCGIIACIGKDEFGQLNKNRLKKDGVNVKKIISTPDYTTGTAFVTYFEDGSRKFIYHFTHAAAGQLAPENIYEEYFQDTEYFHIMGCSLSASESMRKAILKAVKIAQKNDITISFDPNLRPELLEIKKIENVFNSILRVTDILLTGESELKLIFENKRITDLISEFREKGIKIIVLKNGSKGIRLFQGDRDIFIPPIKVKEVDPTGAGDCFDGAFISSLAEGKNYKKAARIGNIAGALSVTKKGPMEGAALRKEILKRL